MVSPVIEGILITRAVNTTCLHEVEACQRLRYGYFVQDKAWVADNPAFPGREIDRYDSCEHCHHIGTFEGDRLIAYVRMLYWQPDVGMMLDNDFACLISDEKDSLPLEGAAEISRLVAAPDLNRERKLLAFEMMFRYGFEMLKRDKRERLYCQSEASWLPVVNRLFRLPLKQVGITYTFPDGTKTVAAVAEIRDMEQLWGTFPDKSGKGI